MPIKIKPERFYDPRELAMGVKVEMEHTDSPSVASRIARQHLEEFGDYYTRLTKMESRAKRGLAPNPGLAIVSQGQVKWSGQMMRVYDLSNGAHIIGLPIDAGTRVSGWQLHVLDVDTEAQRSGVGEAAVRWLKHTFGAVDVVDPMPDALGFWRKMKKRGLVRDLIYSEGEPGDAANPMMYTYCGREVSKADYETFKRAEAAGLCPFCERPLNRRYGAHRKHIAACARRMRTPA